MIHMTAQSRILLATHPADFRKGLDGFIALCRIELAQDPRSDTLFVFINKDRTMLRILSYDGSGFWLMTKRLSKGKFCGWPSDGQHLSTVTARHLSQLLKGGDLPTLVKVA
jgi:transposase